MRIRHKPGAYAELCDSPLFVRDPPALRGGWRDAFARELPLELELGCGKGNFAAQYALEHPNINLIAVDIKSEILMLAKRRIDSLFAAHGRTPDNVLIMSFDIERIGLMLGGDDVVENIYINFCNPWPKQSYNKKRLTHTRQLLKYRDFLRDGGRVFFKTDDAALFEDSLCYFDSAGYEAERVSGDLYGEPELMANNIATEHEKMFRERGVPIYYIRAKKQEM